jgi:hypothetical protein
MVCDLYTPTLVGTIIVLKSFQLFSISSSSFQLIPTMPMTLEGLFQILNILLWLIQICIYDEVVDVRQTLWLVAYVYEHLNILYV